jgi:hypothetical protein
MATTTNYGWTTPDDTALVKDGASAIRTLGSSVDTTTKNLNPSTTLGDIEYRSSTANTNTRLGIGTSGQALTVVAGAPSWAASPTSVLTTTGDILYASAANTLQRLGIGTTGQNLTVAAGVPSWATASSGGMTLISTTSFSGSSITLSSIPQTYYNLQLIYRNFKPASNTALKMRFNGDTGSNYDLANSASSITYGSTSLEITSNANTSTAEGLGVAILYDYTNSVTWKIGDNFSVVNQQASAADGNTNIYKLFYGQTGAITSITLFPNTGNFTSGEVLLYGVK